MTRSAFHHGQLAVLRSVPRGGRRVVVFPCLFDCQRAHLFVSLTILLNTACVSLFPCFLCLLACLLAFSNQRFSCCLCFIFFYFSGEGEVSLSSLVRDMPRHGREFWKLVQVTVAEVTCFFLGGHARAHPIFQRPFAGGSLQRMAERADPLKPSGTTGQF